MRVSAIEPVLGLQVERVPALLVSLGVAEMFFKFGSFTLECLAFLVLWRGLDWVTEKITARRS